LSKYFVYDINYRYIIIITQAKNIIIILRLALIRNSTNNNKHIDGQENLIFLIKEINLIITKSISRFARNTLDSLTTVRKLKEKGIEIYFEKENIWTLYSKGELLITIMSSLAQEESRSISENCTWGIRKKFEEGKVQMAFGSFLGYEKDKDGNIVINERKAKIVKFIYSRFLHGLTPNSIAEELEAKKVPNVRGDVKWYGSTIKSMLKNEKYTGNAILS